MLDRLLAASGHPASDDFGLATVEVERLAGTAHSNRADWQTASRDLSDTDLLALVRFYTLAESHFPAWKSGANSPVIVLARALRGRGAWPPDLTVWIKQNTENRFLPYGNLLDRI